MQKNFESPNRQAIQIAGFAAQSAVNGPGKRIVIWVQGCSLGCPGCFNPGTHGAGGETLDRADLTARILAARSPDTVGVTFSGGEPFQQAGATADVAAQVRQAWPEASIMAFSGYRLEELRADHAPPGAAELLTQLDLLVDGRYDPKLPGRQAWRGSRNQRLWVLGRPFRAARPAHLLSELHINPDGQVLLSGFPDARLRRAVKALS